MKRSKHNLSKYHLCSQNMGMLFPVGWYPVLPGDTVQQSTNALIRVAPLLSPVMHPVRVRIHHWFVPYRLLWDKFEEFITGADWEAPNAFPTISLTNNPIPAAVTNLADHLGLQNPAPGNPRTVSALPFRAYNMIFNEWYRDQDLVDEVPMSTGSGNDTTTELNVKRAAWEKDYFTLCRPWTSKGPDITIPLSGTAPVISDGSSPNFTGGGVTNSNMFVAQSPNRFQPTASPPSTGPAIFGNNSGLEADLSNATDLASINELREAFALMRYQEARAQYGSRYTEYLRYLGVKSSDARLQRPEYLGGGQQVIQFSEVLQTAEGEEPVGEMYGHGISTAKSNRFRRFFEEHGVVMTLMSVIPKTVYMDATEREWFKTTKEDFWQKELEHIGQQEVFNKEVKLTHLQPNGVFGYNNRYEEYRRGLSTVAGEFRTSELNYWTMARDFSGAQPASDPVLNESFIESNPTDRIYAAGESVSNQLYIMAKHSIQARRLVTRNGGSNYVR